MKTEMYRFNGNLYSANQKVTLTFYVEIHCVQSFLKELDLYPMNKNGYGYTIEKEIGYYYISNLMRKGKRIIVSYSASTMCKKLMKLGFHEHSEIRDEIRVYQYRFDKNRNGKLPCVLIWKPKRGWYLQRRNFPVTYNSVYSNGKHYVAMNHILSF